MVTGSENVKILRDFVKLRSEGFGSKVKTVGLCLGNFFSAGFMMALKGLVVVIIKTRFEMFCGL